MRASRTVNVPEAEPQHREPDSPGALLEPKPEAEEEIQTCVHSLTTAL